MNRTKKTSVGFTLAAFGCAISACAPESPEEVFDSARVAGKKEQGIIIGANDLVPVDGDGGNVPAKYRSLLDGFGRAVYNGALCSATHVGDGIVVSAGHCFGAPAYRENNVSCSGGYVQFGYRHGRTPFVSNCQEILAQQDGDNVDYAIYRVSPVPPVAVPADVEGNPAVGVPLTIFSHPGGRRLEWSQVCSASSNLSREFRYQCDTQGGSSGSAVLNDNNLQVVGLHWGGGGNHNIATKLSETPLRDYLDSSPPSSGGNTVRFVSRHSGKCLDVSGSGTANGTNVQLWSCNGSDAQNFRMEDRGGPFRFINVASNKCLDVSGGSVQDGANIQIWDCNGTGAQSFWFDDVGSGYFGLINANSDRAVDVGGWGTDSGTNILQWSYHAGDNQTWRVENTGCSGVTFYQHTNYGGYSVTLPPGEYDYGAMVGRGIGNDDVSSVRVPAGCSTTLFQHSGFGGDSLTRNGDDPTLVDDNWNDAMSSVIVY